jgi:hypothetical protein
MFKVSGTWIHPKKNGAADSHPVHPGQVASTRLLGPLFLFRLFLFQALLVSPDESAKLRVVIFFAIQRVV